MNSLLVPIGWKLLRNSYYYQSTSFENISLKPYLSPLQIGEGKISGDDLWLEVCEIFPAGASVLDFLLANPHEITEEIKALCPLSFFGTIYEDPTGRQCVRILCHSIIDGEEKFYWRWRWLSDFWRKNNPVLLIEPAR